MGHFNEGPHLVFDDGIPKSFCEFANSMYVCLASLITGCVGAAR